MTLLIFLIMGLLGDILGSVTGGFLDIGSTGLNILGSSMLQSDAQDFQRNEWTRQFYLSNQRQDELIRSQREYESPAAYIERLRQVGINPAALLQTGGSLLGQQVPTSVNTPSGVTSPHFAPSDIGFGQHIEAFGNFVKAMADAKKTGLDSQLLQDTFDDQIRLLREKVSSYQLENANKSLDNYVKNEVKDVAVKKAYKEYDYLCTLETNARFMGKNIEADTSLKAAQRLLTVAQEKLSSEQFQELSIIVRNKQRLIDSEISRNKGAAAAGFGSNYVSRAMHDYYVSLTKTNDLLRDGQGQLQQLSIELTNMEKLMRGSDMRVHIATEKDRLTASIAMLEREGILTEKAKVDAEKAAKENNWYEVQQIVGLAGQAISSYCSAFNASTQRLNTLTSFQRNQIQERFVNAYDKYHNTEHETFETWIDRYGNIAAEKRTVHN